MYKQNTENIIGFVELGGINDILSKLEEVDESGDGASPNRKFFYVKSKELIFKYHNPYAKEERYIYFISDVPHLMKTTRNCWSHSFWNGNKRTLWVRSCMHVRIYT